MSDSAKSPETEPDVSPVTGRPSSIPGVREIFGWTAGLSLVHTFATLLLLLLAANLLIISGRWNEILLGDAAVPGDLLLMLLGGDQMLVLLATLLAVRWRFGRELAGTLSLRPLSRLHFGLIVGLVLPLSCVSSLIYQITAGGWQLLTEVLPALHVVDQLNTVSFLGDLGDLASLPMMVILLAIGPALGEELIFRGVIGRGLVARWGLWSGVLTTSVLFALVHLHPVHVVAVIPLGIALHLVYLATRSFWGAVLLHFCNNAWATFLLKWPLAPQQASGTVWEGEGLGLIVASLVAMIVLGTLLYHTRTRYLLGDGTEWSPGYVSTETPPATVDTRLEYGPWTRRNLATAAVAWASFAVAFVAELTAFAR